MLDNKIVLLCYPPHTSHALQGLDVVIFGHLKENWVEACDDFSSSHRQTIGKHNFLHIFAVTFQWTFTPPNIIQAFTKTGIWPFNSSKITPQLMALSIETSINPEHLFMDSHGVVQRLTDIFGQLYEEATPTHVQGEGQTAAHSLWIPHPPSIPPSTPSPANFHRTIELDPNLPSDQGQSGALTMSRPISSSSDLR